MIRFMQEGGIYSWAVLSFALMALGFALAHVFVARRWTLITAGALLLLLLAIGVAGRQFGRRQTDRALHWASDDRQAQRLQAMGYRQAARPLQLGLGAAGVILIPLAIGSARMLRRRED